MARIEAGKVRPPEDTYRVLVLDGKSDHMPRLTAACKRAGQEVVPCHSIKEAFAFLVTKDHVDVILAEAFLSDESVFEFLKTAKSTPEHKDVPIMIVASEPGAVANFCMPGVEIASRRLGAFKFIVLPEFDEDLLVREIQAILPVQKLPRKEQDPTGAY